MKFTSDDKLPTIINLGDGHYQFSYNQQSIEVDGMVVNEFDHIQLPPPVDWSKLIAALIGQHYTTDDQIAIIFNKEDGSEKHLKEFVDYNTFRETIKEIVHVLLT